MATLIAPSFSVEDFLAQERGKDLFRFSTAGSVDDGKSTLIGRLLYDTQSVYEDQVRSIEGKGTTAPGQIDFALLTDGLRAEREQGITIDVAYRYFSTARRKFIIADTPGHEQYTRNMATGASTADAAVVLIDASKGVLVQSRRHAYIASLLRVRHILVAVNKMDLIGYDESVFRAIESDFRLLLNQIAADTGNPVEPVFVPVSALAGDNIVHRANTQSGAMPWYDGLSLLELLEALPSSVDTRSAPFRFPVQRVLRPDHTFRGFAGQIASGTIRPGDKITVLPSGRSAEVERIVTWDGDLAEAHAPLSVTLVLNHELDISRGDILVSSESPATVAKKLKASLVWMDQRPLDRNRRYLLKHTSHTVPAHVAAVEHRTDIGTLSHEPAETLEMNGIGVVSIELLRPIAIDLYGKNRSTGAFILIDPETNGTVAAGMVTATSEDVATSASALERVTVEERSIRWGHRGGVLELNGPEALIEALSDAIERSLFTAGAVTGRIDVGDSRLAGNEELRELLLQSYVESGLITLVVTIDDSSELTARAGNERLALDAGDFNSGPNAVIAAVHQLLVRTGILLASGKAGAL
jgi:sulfate adenylyltransferase subunit 1